MYFQQIARTPSPCSSHTRQCDGMYTGYLATKCIIISRNKRLEHRTKVLKLANRWVSYIFWRIFNISPPVAPIPGNVTEAFPNHDVPKVLNYRMHTNIVRKWGSNTENKVLKLDNPWFSYIFGRIFNIFAFPPPPTLVASIPGIVTETTPTQDIPRVPCYQLHITILNK